MLESKPFWKWFKKSVILYFRYFNATSFLTPLDAFSNVTTDKTEWIKNEKNTVLSFTNETANQVVGLDGFIIRMKSKCVMTTVMNHALFCFIDLADPILFSKYLKEPAFFFICNYYVHKLCF